MNNNFNQMGQFGGWSPSPYGYGVGSYNEQYLRFVQKEEEKKKIRKIGQYCGLAVLGYVIISYAISFLILFISWIYPSISKIYNETLPTLAFDIAITVLSVGIPFIIIHFLLKKEKTAVELPFGKTENKKIAICLVMIFLPVMVISAVAINYISAFVQALMGIEFTAAVNEIKLAGIKETLLGVLSVAIVPAIIEETVIRGVLMQPLRKYGDKFAILMSALVFACMHGNMVQIPYTVVGGCLLGYLAVVTESLWPSIILHFINNLYSVIAISVNDNFGETASTISVLVMLSIFAVVGIIGVVQYKKIKEEIKLSKNDELLNTKEKISAFLVNPPAIIAIIVLILITLSNVIKA